MIRHCGYGLPTVARSPAVIRLFHIEIASGEYIGKYDPRVMYDSKRNVADLLNEHEEKKSVWEFLRHQKSQAQEIPQKRRGEWER